MGGGCYVNIRGSECGEMVMYVCVSLCVYVCTGGISVRTGD